MLAVCCACAAAESGSGKTDGHYDIADKKDLVSICYSTWFNPVINEHPDKNGDGVPDVKNISEILAGKGEWGGEGEFHYWGKPALGYYRSDDKKVIRTHMKQLSDAGIDFIIIDNTNANLSWDDPGTDHGSGTYWHNMVTEPTVALLDTIVEMRAKGEKTPYVTFWCKDWDVVNNLLEKYVKDPKYEDCFVYWGGKPFFIMVGKPDTDNVKVAWKPMWGLREEKGEWSFLQKENKPNYDKDGNVEQMCVCVAMQQTYMSNTKTATGRNGGKTFWKQWQNAFKYRPKIITITWWNEWVAQRLPDNQNPPVYQFTDNYNQEFSRDIEPMEGGHGDQYYRWMCEYIKAYKAGKECPELHE